MGIPKERIQLKRNPSPIVFGPSIVRSNCLMRCTKDLVLSFTRGIGGLRMTSTPSSKLTRNTVRQSRHGLKFWLNAVGAKADRVEKELRRRGIFVYRTRPVPLEQLPPLLLTADVHLITLSDAFVGYVLPSKVHACINMREEDHFVGSEKSDVHLLASCAFKPLNYYRVGVGDTDRLVKVFHDVESALVSERKRQAASKRVSIS